MTKNEYVKNRSSIIPTVVAFIIALALVVVGYRNNEHKSYYQKAILICTQCIGLG